MVRFLRRKDTGQAFKVGGRGSSVSGLSSSSGRPFGSSPKKSKLTSINKKLPRLLRKPTEIANRKFDESRRNRKIKKDNAERELVILERRARLEDNDKKLREIQATRNLLLKASGLPEQEFIKTTEEIHKSVKALPSEPTPTVNFGKVVSPITPDTTKKEEVKSSGGIFGSSKPKTGTIPMEGSLPQGTRSSDQPVMPSGVVRSPMGTTKVEELQKKVDEAKLKIDSEKEKVSEEAKKKEQQQSEKNQTKADKETRKQEKKQQKELQKQKEAVDRAEKEQKKLLEKITKAEQEQELKDVRELAKEAEREQKSLLEEANRDSGGIKSNKEDVLEKFERRRQAVKQASFDF